VAALLAATVALMKGLGGIGSSNFEREASIEKIRRKHWLFQEVIGNAWVQA
jgi:hypothetical protein